VIDYTYREHVGMRLARQFGASVGEGLYKAASLSGIAVR
jgi:protease-4